jgi:histidinol phosphatase-like PHP family hydrolase
MKGMYDLHTHSLISDGEMLPVELARRMAVLGYTTIAITDHVDASNISDVIAQIMEVQDSAKLFGVSLLCGVEITHVHPKEIAQLAGLAKAAGADIVVVHGETLVEPVAPGTNHAACSCRDVDVLAHPGLITEKDALLAAKNGIALEITSRAGHNRANGHVAKIAGQTGCRLVVDSDAHAPNDLLDKNARMLVALGAGLSERESRDILNFDVRQLISR